MRRSGAGLLQVGFGTILLFFLSVAAAQAAWFDPAWRYRVPVNVPAGAAANSTVKLDVDFAALLATLGVSGTFDVNSPRIVRPNDSLAATQEFTDALHAGATDAVGNGRGEVRFILQDAGPATYHLYFDIVANGPKTANPQVPINGNFERGGTGTATPPGWATTTRSNSAMDIQIRPAETLTVADATTATTSGTPNTGQFSYLIGHRTNPDNANSHATLTRTIVIPSSNPGNINIRIRPQGWDSAVNGNTTQYDFIRVRLLHPTTSAVLLDIVGPARGNYATCPFSPNYGLNVIGNTTPGYGLYNHWDNGRNANNHTLGMSSAYDRGREPWVNCSASLAGIAGQTVRLEIRANIFNQYRSWFLIDDVEWSVSTATLGAPEAAPAFHHLRIEHAGSGVTCTPTTLTLRACADAACSAPFAGGVAGTLTATGTPTVNWIGGAGFSIPAGSGSVTKNVQVTTAGTVSWSATGLIPAAPGATRCFVGATESCNFTAALAGFLFDVPHHAAGVVQNVQVGAVRQADGSLACTPAFTGSRTVNFSCSYGDPASGARPVVVGGSDIACGGGSAGIPLSFDASGVANATVRYDDVGRMTLSASFTGSGSEAGLVMTGSDTFIAAPASLRVTPTGPYVAGNNFSVAVAAQNASGNTTPNFGKESTTENVVLTHTLTGPAGGNNPALTGATTLADAAFQSGNGVASTGVAWGEVGDIALTATLTNYLGSGLGATGSAAAGPFRPARLETVVTPGTGSFTYSGQPFAVRVTAMNAAGAPTLNYQGAYARTVTLADANSAINLSGTLGSLANATVAAAAFSAGAATAHTVTYTFANKTTAPLEAPASAPLLLRATDTDGATSAGHAEGTTPIRAGRLRLLNYHGSELLRARVEYRAEFWDGNRWATNTLDASNPIVAGNIATGGLTVNGIAALNNGSGFITFNTAAAGSYDIAFNLNAAGANTACVATAGGAPANRPWLQGYWSAPAHCGGVAAWAQDPGARVRLGSPRAPYIYLRERY